MEAAGQAPWIVGFSHQTNEEGGYLGTAELLREHPEVTAVFTANDTMALGARAALQETGRRVPHDVSLVGFDNSQLAQSRFLSLTTVDNHAFDAGIACAEALLRRFAAPDAPPRHVVLATSLVARSSSARAAGHTGRTAG